MTDFCNYSKTFSKLQKLQNLLKCKKCEELSKGLYTLGSCEHMFCRECCDGLLGNECPVCSIPTHVKDATVNRPITNILGLCQELENILLRGQPSLKTKHFKSITTSIQDELECTPQTHISMTESTNIRPDYNSVEGRYQDNATVTTNLDKSNTKLNTSHTKTNNVIANRDSELKENVFKPKTSKNTRVAQRKIPDQTTMTQFYDTDESGNDNGNDNDNGNGNYGNNDGNDDDNGDDNAVDDNDADDDNELKDDNEDEDYVPSVESKEALIQELSSRHSIPQTSRQGRTKSRSKVKSVSPSMGPQRKVSSRGRKPDSISTMPQSCKKGRFSHDSYSTPQSKQKRGSRSVTPKSTPQSRRNTGQPSTPGLNTSLTSSGRSASKSSQVKRNAKGETPLHVAAIKGDYNKVEELLKNGASTNVRENAGWTPLHEAVNHGHVKIAELLLNHGAMVNTPGLDNDTPLHDAINNNRLDCVRLLVSWGAALSSRNIHGVTPRDLAMSEAMREALDTSVDSQMSDSCQQIEEEENYQMLCFLGTGLTRDEKIQLQKCATMLQAKVVEDFCPEVTHIITKCNRPGLCPRTLKYLRGILLGKWIVNMDWVATCQEFGTKVAEEGFEVPGSSTNPDSHAPYKGRQNRKQQLPGFFDGCQFYFHGIFEYPTPEKEELVDLVKAGGGRILTREPKLQNIDEYPVTVPYHADTASLFSDCSVFIVHDSNLAYPKINSSRMCAVPASWILESIASFKFQNLK